MINKQSIIFHPEEIGGSHSESLIPGTVIIVIRTGRPEFDSKEPYGYTQRVPLPIFNVIRLIVRTSTSEPENKTPKKLLL